MAENQKVDLSTLPKGLTKEEFTALPNFKKIRSFFTWAGIYRIRYIRSIEYRTHIAKHTSEWRKP